MSRPRSARSSRSGSRERETLDSRENQYNMLAALGDLVSQVDGKMAPTITIEEGDEEGGELDMGWIDNLFAAMPDLEKELRFEMRREAAGDKWEQQRQKTLSKLEEEERQEADFRRRRQAAQEEFKRESKERVKQQAVRRDMAADYLRARDARAESEGERRRREHGERALAKEARDAAAAAEWREKNGLHTSKTEQMREKAAERERRRLTAAVRRQEEMERRERERR